MNPPSASITSSLHNHAGWKTSIPDSQFRTTCHQPLNWKTFIQYPPKLFQSVVRKVKFRDRFEGLDTASFGNLRKSPEYVGHFSKVMEIFFGSADKMHTKVSLLWPSKREQFSVVLFALLQKKFDPRLFFGSFLGSRQSAIGQLFSLSLATIPELFAKVNSAEFPCSFVSSV